MMFGHREQEGEKERVQDFFLRSSEFHQSEFVEPRTNIHCLNENYACVPTLQEKMQFLTYIILTYDNICQYCVFKLAIMTYITYFKAIMTYIKLVHDLG